MLHLAQLCKGDPEAMYVRLRKQYPGTESSSLGGLIGPKNSLRGPLQAPNMP